MRTTIIIDDALMAEAMEASGAKTRREAVELGLRALIRLKGQEDIRRVRGRLAWNGDLGAARSAD